MRQLDGVDSSDCALTSTDGAATDSCDVTSRHRCTVTSGDMTSDVTSTSYMTPDNASTTHSGPNGSVSRYVSASDVIVTWQRLQLAYQCAACSYEVCHKLCRYQLSYQLQRFETS